MHDMLDPVSSTSLRRIRSSGETAHDTHLILNIQDGCNQHLI